jgi:hypothetical protein
MCSRQSRHSMCAAFAVSLTLAACGDNHGPAGHWQLVGSKFREAVLSISGSSATNVWAVGADGGAGPLVLHYDGASWRRVRTGTTGSLWWTQVFPDGTVYMAGAQSTILHSKDGATFTRMATPGLAAHTIFGVWGRNPSDVYAVGSVSGRNGFVWHYDGVAWTDVPVTAQLPVTASCNEPGVFKVWGDDAGRVYVVGGRGVLLRKDGAGDFQPIDTGSDGTLFTVSGTADRVIAVGGTSAGEILEAPIGQGAVGVAPVGTALLQGVAVAPDGHGWATGAAGSILERSGGTWRVVDTGLPLSDIESLHAVWIDPSGGAWAVGGNVLGSKLDQGAVLHWGPREVSPIDPATVASGGTGAAPAPAVCPAAQIDPAPSGSIARRWNEQAIGAIRRDIPRPTVHARNLYHASAAIWDAWVAYDATADGAFSTERATAADIEVARREAISYAAYRVLVQRYERAVGGAVSMACFRAFMTKLGYDPDATATTGGTPRALGNRIAAAVIQATLHDGANEIADYADATAYKPVNRPLIVDEPGIQLADPNHWQELNLALAETQNGIVTPAGVQSYIGSNWANVTPFAMARATPDALYQDPGPPPQWDQPEMQGWLRDLLERSAALDHSDGRTLDISPGAFGNNSLGADDGRGHPMNPVTGTPYAPNPVPRGDFARVLAEFWADGPRSETPPGHWFVLANSVADHPMTTRKLFGVGAALDPLAWDVHVYLALGGAVHDAAIVAWELKRKYTAMRPISMVRYLAQLGQSSEPGAADFNAHGLPLVPGVVERVTAASSAPGERHERLRRCVGQLAIRTWRGEPGDRGREVGGVGWVRALDWIPYQRRTFVTPAFPGFTSGHSTFSRAAAEALTAVTGSEFFPGGFSEFVAPKDAYLVFEDGPSADVGLQWATYFDAADQAGASRIYGGIHLQPDDFAGRRTGSRVGVSAVARARLYYDGTVR